jgi:integrase
LGLRAGEVITLQLEDIDWDNGQFHSLKERERLGANVSIFRPMHAEPDSRGPLFRKPVYRSEWRSI